MIDRSIDRSISPAFDTIIHAIRFEQDASNNIGYVCRSLDEISRASFPCIFDRISYPISRVIQTAAPPCVRLIDQVKIIIRSNVNKLNSNKIDRLHSLHKRVFAALNNLNRVNWIMICKRRIMIKLIVRLLRNNILVYWRQVYLNSM